ncbi:MAG: T9SS type A sorting domain-containing protein [Ignavibacteriales bacterium]|nr:T9SS type A sorting domain-containing protein [Ignavibacteriales bacterium]
MKKNPRGCEGIFKKNLAGFRIAAILIPLILSLTSLNVYEPVEKISGIISNGSRSLPFARVRVKATQISATADFSGRFALQGVSTSDSVVVTAWAEGYYNGESKAVAGDTNVVVILTALPSRDDSSYQFIFPGPDSTAALSCGNCHAEVLMNQWRNDAHGQSGKNPFFYAMYNGTDIKGNPNIGFGYKLDFPQTNGNCATCHMPGAALNNPWGANPNEKTGTILHGIFCDFCHKMYKVTPSTGQGTTGVLSITMLRPSQGNQVFFGPYDDIREPDAYLPLMRKSEICAPCHTGKFWGTPAYDCFPEWQSSPYPAMGVECQTCHMAPDRVTTNFAPGKGGLERDPLTIPSHLMPGSRDPKILANSVTMKLKAQRNNDSVKVMVTIYNDKTGHHVPTGHTSRNMILQVIAKGSAGDTLRSIGGEKVPRWGGVGDISKGNYSGVPGKGFAKILEDLDGYSPAPQWRQTRILGDNRLAAFAIDTSYYYFRTPSSSQKVTIEARLVFRRFFKPWMDEKGFDIPDIVMTDTTVSLSVTSVAVAEERLTTQEPFFLEQNYPNPFNQSTIIRFTLKEATHVVMKLVSVSGEEVSTLVDGSFSSGSHQIHLDASRLSSGTYFCKMKTGSGEATRKIVVLK